MLATMLVVFTIFHFVLFILGLYYRSELLLALAVILATLTFIAATRSVLYPTTVGNSTATEFKIVPVSDPLTAMTEFVLALVYLISLLVVASVDESRATAGETIWVPEEWLRR